MSRLLHTVNPCFPRSGHRFLRSICQTYFGKDMKFKSVHMVKDRAIEDANYVKDHDFGLWNDKPDCAVTPEAQYLIQYRHPLESVQSYFEFRVHHGRNKDTAESWAEFLPWGMDYWKAFVGKWCLDAERMQGVRCHVVRYGDLYADTMGSVESAITFLTGGQEEIDRDRLEKAVGQFTGGFARYAQEQSEGARTVKRARDIRDFRYFDESLYEIEDSLAADYLAPLGLTRLREAA